MAGVDTKQERDLLNFRPDIARILQDVITPAEFTDIGGAPLGRETPTETEKTDKEIQDYIEIVGEIDDLFYEINRRLEEQQKGLSIPVSSDEEPMLSDALLYLTDGKQSNIISYEVWRKAQDILEKGNWRSLGGDPLQITDLDTARRTQEKIQKADDINMIAIAWRALKASVYNAIAKIVPNVYPLSKLRDKLKKLGREAAKHTIPDLGIDRLQGEDEERDSIPSYPYITTDTGELVKPPGVGATIRAKIVSDRVTEYMMNAGSPYLRGYNPNAFLINSAVHNAHKIHIANKAILHYMGYEVPNAARDKLDTWGNYFWSKGHRLSSIAGRLPKSLAVALARSEPDQLRDALQNTIFDFDAWTQGITTNCCFIRSLAGLGTADIRVLYGIKLLIAWKINKADEAIETIINAGLTFANSILTGLIAKIMTPLQVAYEGWLLDWHNAAKGALSPGVQNCTPLDEFLDEIYGFMDQLGDELIGMIGSYTSQLKLGTVQFAQQRKNLAQKAHLETMLWLTDEIIKALKNAEFCQEEESVRIKETADITNTTGSPLKPSENEVAEFLTRRNIIDSNAADYIQQRNNRVSESIFTNEDIPEEIVRVFSDCNSGPSDSDILEMKDRLMKRFQNGNNS